MGRSRLLPAILSTIAQWRAFCAPVRRILFRGIAWSVREERSNFALKPRLSNASG
jgi:hypothetical protein